MILNRHPLLAPAPGTARELHSLHYGPAGGAKAVIQASLHADEVPPMLVVHHLRERLAALEARGLLRAEVVLVPVANPVGLSQQLMHGNLGRFDFASGQNFNRHYPELLERVVELLGTGLVSGAAGNVATVRAALRSAVTGLQVEDELQSLRRTLLSLAIDADLVLDLHCDCEAVLHLYTATQSWPEVEPLARLIGAEASLLATHSGDEPFDEACSMIWPRLADRLGQGRAAGFELPSACTAVTVELRGETDVDHALAARDAQCLVDYLAWRGMVAEAPVTLPPLRQPATPLAGSMPVTAPHGGVVVYQRALGETLRRGDRVADLVDPLSGVVTPLVSPTDGVLYARERLRFAPAGTRVAKVAGHEAVRSGNLLSA